MEQLLTMSFNIREQIGALAYGTFEPKKDLVKEEAIHEKYLKEKILDSNSTMQELKMKYEAPEARFNGLIDGPEWKNSKKVTEYCSQNVTSTQNDVYDSQECLSVSNLSTDLSQHDGHASRPPNPSMTCQIETGFFSNFDSQPRIHEDLSSRLTYQPNDVPYTTKSAEDLRTNIQKQKSSSNAISFHCDECQYRTKYKIHLKTHALKHKNPSEVTMYHCDTCSFQSKYDKCLKRHSLIHKHPSEIKMFSCPRCPYVTKYGVHLKTHSLKHKDPSEVKMHNCGHCQFQTKYVECMKRHQLRHGYSEVPVSRRKASWSRSSQNARKDVF